MSEPKIKTENEDEDRVESPVRYALISPSMAALEAIVEKRRNDRDRSPVRRRVFPVVQEVQEQRRIALQKLEEQAAIAKVARVNQQEAEIKKWIETKYVTGRTDIFRLEFGSVESEVVAQLREEGYQIGYSSGDLVFHTE